MKIANIVWKKKKKEVELHLDIYLKRTADK